MLRHKSLPQHLTIEELQQWIQKAAVQRFRDTTKRYYTDEEIQEFEHESAQNGLQIVKLKAILDQVREAVTKGIQEPLTIVIPENLGTKLYDEFRGQNYGMILQGYEEIDVDVFAIVNQLEETMEFFTLDGQIIEERTRPLSAKEKKEYLTVKRISDLPKSGPKLYVEVDNVDSETGEVLGRTGTEG